MDKEKPHRSRDDFWKFQINVSAQRFFGMYRHPTDSLKQLGDIADYCRIHGISLVFVVLPNHADLQRLMRDRYGLAAAESQMLCELSKMGRVCNYDVVNEMTQSEMNFNDPFHLKGERLREIELDIWGSSSVGVDMTGESKRTTEH